MAHNVVNQKKKENNFLQCIKHILLLEMIYIQSFIFERKHEIFNVFSVNISTFKMKVEIMKDCLL